MGSDIPLLLTLIALLSCELCEAVPRAGGSAAPWQQGRQDTLTGDMPCHVAGGRYPEGARAAHLLLGAAPGQRGRHEPHKGGALLVGAVRRVEGDAAHLQLLPLQQRHQALLAGVRLLRPCNATCTQSKP